MLLVNCFWWVRFTKNFTKNDRRNTPKYVVLRQIWYRKYVWLKQGKILKNLENSGFFERKMTMIKILFVCHGNICRSPIAEFVLKDLVQKQKIAPQFEIASAATSTEEIWNGVGNPVYPPARKELAKHGISCEGKRAVQLKKSDYDYYDYLIGMDTANIRNIERMTGHKGGKISMLLQYAGRNDSISDPWYTNDFETTYRDVLEGCEGFLNHLKKEGKI